MNDRSIHVYRGSMKTKTQSSFKSEVSGLKSSRFPLQTAGFALRSASGLILLALLAGAASAAENTIHGRITYEAQEGVYVNVGTDGGLTQGLTGTLQFEDGRTVEFEVLHAARQSALLRLPGYPWAQRLLDHAVQLTFEPPGRTPAPGGHPLVDSRERLSSSTAEGGCPTEPGQGSENKSQKAPPTTDPAPGASATKEFVPLLTPVQRPPETVAPGNISHGRVEVRQSFQTDSENDLGYAVTRLRSSGSMERIANSPWNFSWSGDLRYRGGDVYRNHPDYQEVQPDFYQLMFQRPIEDGGFLRFGRFVPIELPSVGYVDGLQGETRRGEGLRFGAIAGLKPNRVNLDASADEPLVAGYATVEAGRRDGAYYSGTVGVLNSYFQGGMDRLALLLDQRAGLGPALTLYSTATVDLDAGAAQVRDGIRLTQLDVFAESRLSSFLGLRAGVDHWERPDNQAERDLLAFDDPRFFDDGYWRYWVGSYQRLPWSLQLYEEVALIDADNTGDSVRWQARLTRTGLFSMPNASATITVYTLAGDDSDGYGGSISGYFPFCKGKLAVQPMAGYRTLQAGSQAQDISLTYLSLYLDGRLSKTWTVFGGLNYNSGDGVDSTLIEVGLRYSW
jgi:hypothetical protein